MTLFKPIICGIAHLRNRHLIVTDLVGLVLTPALALLCRVDRIEHLAGYLAPLATFTAGMVLIRVSLFLILDLYNRHWTSASADDLAHTALATLAASAIVAVPFYAGRVSAPPAHTLPLSLPILEGLLAICWISGTRYLVRAASVHLRMAPVRNTGRVLIAGAGYSGQKIAEELLAHPKHGLRPVAFIDDDAATWGLRIHGVPVVGDRRLLRRAVRTYKATQAIIAMPSAAGKDIREYLRLCSEAGLPAKTVPGLAALLDDRVSVSKLREVDIEDLLRRSPVHTDRSSVEGLLQGSRILITGAGGSIGSELGRQLLSCNPAALGLLGHGENSIFEILNELKKMESTAAASSSHWRPVDLSALICDTRDRSRLFRVIEDFRPDVIFHAAAHKHVPLMEGNPAEAVTNNVFGTKNLVDAATAAGVDRLVMISTDKAVNPSSIMGATKRVAEMLVLDAARKSGRQYVAVRFGNVLGSRGSVVPIFKRQIASGGPVTVSDPEMRRYFMTIPEAVQLVLQAAVLGGCGRIFMLDMGEPVRIVDMARDLIRLSGLEVGRDIEIVFTGIRPGEKLFEELTLSGEDYRATSHPKVMCVRNGASLLNSHLYEMLPRLDEAVSSENREEIYRTLRTLIPEFTGGLKAERERAVVRHADGGQKGASNGARPGPAAMGAGTVKNDDASKSECVVRSSHLQVSLDAS